MRYAQNPFLRSSKTPRGLKILLYILLAVALVTGALSQILEGLIGPWSPEAFLSLSLWGMNHLFLWQFVTFLFVIPERLSLFFALYLAIELYLLWRIGSALVDRVGQKACLFLFFLAGVLSGLAALLVLWATHNDQLFSGAFCSIYAFLMAWTMFDPQLRMPLLLPTSLKIKWLVLGLYGFNCLLNLANADYASLAAHTVGLLTGYFYPLIRWRLRSPFESLHPFEQWLTSRLSSRKSRRHRSALLCKHYDFQTGSVTIEQKLARYGESALTAQEKRLLRKSE